MALHAQSEIGLIEARARFRWDRYREHFQDEHWHTGAVPPEWDELHYVERVILLKTETDMYDEYRLNRS